jgi:hypothetical protein
VKVSRHKLKGTNMLTKEIRERLESSIRLLTNSDGTYGVTVCSIGDGRADFKDGDMAIPQLKRATREEAESLRKDYLLILLKALGIEHLIEGQPPQV